MNKKADYDGLTHVNVYSQGKTELGRFLSNFAQSPIVTEDGSFASIEGYWYWLSCKDDRLRLLHGYSAKALGREVGGKDWMDDAEFKRKICSAIQFKMETPEAKDILKRNSHLLHLPLEHYYVYGNKVIRPKEGKWIIDKLESIISSY